MNELRKQTANANAHTERGMAALDQSIATDGWIGALTVAADGEAFDGSARLEVGPGFDDPIVIESDGTRPIVHIRTDIPTASDPRAVRLGLAANRVAELNLAWSAEVLASLDVDMSGLWTDDELALLTPEPIEGAGGDDFDTTPDEGPTRVQPGELWQLGRHRLLCGDSTKAEDVARLMGGERAAICFTSPPYNIADNGKLSFHPDNRVRKYIDKQGDNLSESGYLAFLSAFTDAAMSVSDYVIVNLQQLAGNKVAFIEYQYLYKDHFADVMVWHKQRSQPAMATGVMNSDFEFILFLSSAKDANRAVRTGSFRGTVSNVYVAPPQQDNEFADVHGATFPLHLPTMITDRFSSRDDIVIDPFSGTGTTIIACERTGRRCYGIEIEPKYCDVILKRFTAETGIEPERIDG